MDRKQEATLRVKVNIINGPTVVIVMIGELSIFIPEFQLFYQQVGEYISEGLDKFIIDLDQITYIDSSGIGLLIKLAANTMKNNTKICIICEQPQVRKALTLANIDRIFYFVQNLEEGVDYYGLPKSPR
jgi:anti-sigma B factor antagonist